MVFLLGLKKGLSEEMTFEFIKDDEFINSLLYAFEGRIFQAGESAAKVLGGQDAQQGHCGWNTKNKVGRYTGPGAEDKQRRGMISFITI